MPLPDAALFTDVHFSVNPRRACKDADLDLFFAEGIDPEATQAREAALAICAVCPEHIKTDCREHGIKYEKFGIWGGMKETDRRAVRSARRRNAA